jgi:hypothetical protein
VTSPRTSQKQARGCAFPCSAYAQAAFWAIQSALTSDLRRAVGNRVRETGLPSLGYGSPFILTPKWRLLEKGTRKNWILRSLLRRKCLTEIRKSAFVKAMLAERLMKGKHARCPALAGV